MPEDFYFPNDMQINFSNYNLPIEEIKAIFSTTLETKYENGIYYIKDIGVIQTKLFTYLNYEYKNMTLVDG